MPFKKYINELNNIERRQQNIYILTIIILSILSIIRDSIYKEYQIIIISILFVHIYGIYYMLSKKNIGFLLFIILFTLFTACYLTSFFQLNSIYLFFIGFEIGLTAIYNILKKKVFVFLLVFLVILSPFLNYIINNEIFSYNFNPALRILVDDFNWIIAAILIVTKVYFTELKKDLLITHCQNWERNKEIVNKKYEENIDVQKLDELLILAYKNHLNFIVLFEEYYPIFTKKIKDLIPNVVVSEFEVIALLKLNLSTKEIARITNSTVRSIESKKYRIRKKMNIPSDMDMSIFFSEL
jgi:hypothetical protein